MIVDYITTIEAAKLWGITERQVQSRCKSGNVDGAIYVRRVWLIPKSTTKPIDGRTKAAKQLKTDKGGGKTDGKKRG
jgi:hypothetical protein